MNSRDTSSRIGYCRFAPTLTHIVTVKLHIGGSNIERETSDNSYSLKVTSDQEINLFADNSKQQTSFQHVKSESQSLYWNEDIIFHGTKNFNDMKFKFILIKKNKKSQTWTSDEKTVTLNTICENPNISLKIQKKKHKVYITNIGIDFKPDVRVRKDLQLCDEEDTFCSKRREIVQTKLKELGFKEMNDVKQVPNIAIIGSGGGMRAVVGMCGAMNALKDLGILDTAMYTAGVSGSSWYISTLYANEFGFDPKKVNDSVQKRLETAPRTLNDLVMSFIGAFTTDNIQGKHVTLTDLYGGAVGDILLGKEYHSKWSDQREKLSNSGVPLPLLAALHVRDQATAESFHEWIEFSPYEVFLPKYGTAIDMKHFGSEFNKGVLTKKYPEQPVRFLQGVCGSAYAIILDVPPKHEKGDKSKSRLQSFLNGIRECIEQVVKIGLGQVPNWFHGLSIENCCQQKEPPLKNQEIATDDDTFMLADAGTVLNSPYPLILHPARKVDVILSFEFSQDIVLGTATSFSELKKAEEWAKENHIPFPEIKIDEIDDNKEMYVFQNDDSPCIMHFMMKTGETAEKEEERMFGQIDLTNYRTYKSQYSEPEFNCLSKLMEFNVKRNEAVIKKCIENAIYRRTNK